ncbi:MAG: hypothetical protein F6K04_19440 [Leptolyngbya sp. SIO4C5]|nr:hypothetical protein [Leptolyngbya sp. SIO4C5]
MQFGWKRRANTDTAPIENDRPSREWLDAIADPFSPQSWNFVSDRSLS